MKVAVLVLVLLLPTVAQAEQGWACTENNVIDKYHVEAQRLYSENTVREFVRSSGLPGNQAPFWEILQNTEYGLIAVIPNASVANVFGQQRAILHGNLVLIDKIQGKFRHVYVSTNDVHGQFDRYGTCIAY